MADDARDRRDSRGERAKEHLEEVQARTALTDRTLDTTSRELRQNATGLSNRRRELEHTGEMAREVAIDAAKLDQQIKQTHDRADAVEPRDADSRDL
jgi:hypothetical protein